MKKAEFLDVDEARHAVYRPTPGIKTVPSVACFSAKGDLKCLCSRRTPLRLTEDYHVQVLSTGTTKRTSQSSQPRPARRFHVQGNRLFMELCTMQSLTSAPRIPDSVPIEIARSNTTLSMCQCTNNLTSASTWILSGKRNLLLTLHWTTATDWMTDWLVLDI